MELSALRLEILKGPREGETLEYRPGSKVRIGRVVRGNNLPIKDFGISTNHLIIESESGKWTVRDLDSSNGTMVNDAALNPNTPLELSDGDEIKTSISVKIKSREEESRLRRNPRRAAVGKVGAVGQRGKAAEASEAKVKPEAEKENDEEIGAAVRVPGRRGRVGKKNEVNCEEKEVEEIEVVEKPKRGRGRPPKAKVLKSEEDLVVEEVAVPEVSTRAGKRSKNVETVVAESENHSVIECEEVKIEPKRRGRKKKNVQEEQLVGEEGNVVGEANDLGEVVLVGVNGDDEDKGQVLEQKDLLGIGGVNDDDDAKGLDLGEGRRVGETGDDNEKAGGSNLGGEASECNVGESDEEDESGSRSCSGAKEGSGKVWQEEPDLEKMTLDDWFDYVEVSWAKVVNDEIDKICAGMREKARLVQECIAQHKKEKGQG